MSYDKHTAGKAMTCATVSGGATAMMFGRDTPVRLPFLGGRAVPLWSAAAAASGVASVGADMVHESIYPAWEKSMVGDQWNTLLTAGAAGAGLNCAVLYAYDPSILRDFGMWQAVAIGAGSEMLGAAIYNSAIRPMM